MYSSLPQLAPESRDLSQSVNRMTVIELLNNKLHGILPPTGLVSSLGGFASLSFDQGGP